MVGMLFTEIVGAYDGSDHIHFVGEKPLHMYHVQDCCESVRVVKVSNADAIIGSPILSVEESASELPPEDGWDDEQDSESNTWTKFVFKTAKGECEILWHGSSNGFYSEGVTIGEALYDW